MLSIDNILETNQMIHDNKLDVRTITMGISLLECASSSGKELCDRIYDRLYRDLCSGHADVRHSGSDSVSGRCTARIFVLLLCGVPSFRGNYRGYRMLLCSGV